MTYRSILIREYEARKRRNPRYSVRAFARHLHLSAPMLSEVMRGRKGMSPRTTRHICETLNLSAIERKLFCVSVEAQFARSKASREAAKQTYGVLLRQHLVRRLSVSEFMKISKWHCFAILELARQKRYGEPQRIAEALNLGPKVVVRALTLLRETGLLSANEGTGLCPQLFSLPRDIPDKVKLSFHGGLMERARQALRKKDPRRPGSFSGVIFSISPDRVAAAVESLKNFREQFLLEFGSDDGAQENASVYCYTSEFFSLIKA